MKILPILALLTGLAAYGQSPTIGTTCIRYDSPHAHAFRWIGKTGTCASTANDRGPDGEWLMSWTITVPGKPTQKVGTRSEALSVVEGQSYTGSTN